MSVKALIIEGGETVIADVQEVHDREKQEFLGYRVKDPYVANLIWESAEVHPEVDGAIGNASQAKIDFNYWAPLSDAREFDFVKDYVRVIYEPSPDTLELYFSVLAHHQENYTKEIKPDLSKTVVTMPSEAGPDGAGEPVSNDAMDPKAFDS